MGCSIGHGKDGSVFVYCTNIGVLGLPDPQKPAHPVVLEQSKKEGK